jgi:1,4-dihydroxy-6-naphthoate synthase
VPPPRKPRNAVTYFLNSRKGIANIMRTLSLGISPCPNDVYIFAGILLGAISSPNLRFLVDFEDVQTLNQRALASEGDILKISYAAYPALKDTYNPLPCGGALGRGVGPLLLCNGPVPDSIRHISVPGEQTTANFLLDFYLQRKVNKNYLPFDRLYEHLLATPNAVGVVIHEKRFTYQKDNLTLIQDLGEFWEEKTGFPIPLGAIITKTDLNIAEEMSDLIRQSIRWAESYPEETLNLCRKYADDMDDAVIQAHIDLYVNQYSYDLGAEGQEAVDFFLAQIP